MTELWISRTELYSTGPAWQPAQTGKRNLGNAIFLAAIEDYRSLDEQIHKNAEQFLYPQTPEWQDHYDWVVALAEGLNPAWLRDALDRFRGKWDGQRYARMRSMRPSRRKCELKRRGQTDEARKCS